MIKVENIEVSNVAGALRGMRNPMNSWDKSDSEYVNNEYVIGPNDLYLCKKLIDAGPEHRKFLRQIFVSMDITAPLYWWKEFDTYKVGTVANSCSTMHKLAERPLELKDFSCEHLNDDPIQVNNDHAFYLQSSLDCLIDTIDLINTYREWYIRTKDKQYWWQMIQLLPSSYNQKRTLSMNLENVYSIIRQRKGHKLDEWNSFCRILGEIPIVKELFK